MSNGVTVIICLVSIMLFLGIAAGVAVIVFLQKYLPTVKCFFLNLANGIERNQGQIDELKSALMDCHTKLNASICAGEQKIMNQVQELRARVDAETAAREKAISTTQTAIIEAVGKAKTEFTASAKQNHSSILSKLDAETAAREKAISTTQTAIIDAVGKAKTEFTASAKQNHIKLMDKIDTVQDEISTRLNQLDYISDQCQTTGEMLSGIETNLKSKLSKLAENQTQMRKFTEEIFQHWQEAVESQKSALDSLKNDLENLKDQETRRTKDNRLLLVDIQDKLEARLYGIQSSVMLLNSGVDAASPQEKNEKKKTATRKESRDEIQRADFIPLPGEKTDFETLPDGKTISRTYRDGKLIFEITLSQYGIPEKGTMFSDSGKPIRKFNYGPDGQVK